MSLQGKKGLILGGVTGLAAIGAAAWFFLRGGEKQAVRVDLPRDKVLVILKDLRGEFHDLFSELALMVNHIASQVGGKAPPNTLKQVFLKEDTKYFEAIKSIETGVYTKHGVTEADFQAACAKLKDDQDIALQQKHIKESFEKAFNGVMPDLMEELPGFLTPEKYLDIAEKIYRSYAVTIRDNVIDRYRNGEKVKRDTPEYADFVFSLKLDEKKLKILMENGFSDIEAPNRLFDYAAQKFAQQDKAFVEKNTKLKARYNICIDNILINPEAEHEFLKVSAEPEPAPAAQSPEQGVKLEFEKSHTSIVINNAEAQPAPATEAQPVVEANPAPVAAAQQEPAIETLTQAKEEEPQHA